MHVLAPLIFATATVTLAKQIDSPDWDKYAEEHGCPATAPPQDSAHGWVEARGADQEALRGWEEAHGGPTNPYEPYSEQAVAHVARGEQWDGADQLGSHRGQGEPPLHAREIGAGIPAAHYPSKEEAEARHDFMGRWALHVARCSEPNRIRQDDRDMRESWNDLTTKTAEGTKNLAHGATFSSSPSSNDRDASSDRQNEPSMQGRQFIPPYKTRAFPPPTSKAMPHPSLPVKPSKQANLTVATRNKPETTLLSSFQTTSSSRTKASQPSNVVSSPPTPQPSSLPPVTDRDDPFVPQNPTVSDIPPP